MAPSNGDTIRSKFSLEAINRLLLYWLSKFNKDSDFPIFSHVIARKLPRDDCPKFICQWFLIGPLLWTNSKPHIISYDSYGPYTFEQMNEAYSKFLTSWWPVDFLYFISRTSISKMRFSILAISLKRDLFYIFLY